MDSYKVKNLDFDFLSESDQISEFTYSKCNLRDLVMQGSKLINHLNSSNKTEPNTPTSNCGVSFTLPTAY